MLPGDYIYKGFNCQNDGMSGVTAYCLAEAIQRTV